MQLPASAQKLFQIDGFRRWLRACDAVAWRAWENGFASSSFREDAFLWPLRGWLIPGGEPWLCCGWTRTGSSLNPLLAEHDTERRRERALEAVTQGILGRPGRTLTPGRWPKVTAGKRWARDDAGSWRGREREPFLSPQHQLVCARRHGAALQGPRQRDAADGAGLRAFRLDGLRVFVHLPGEGSLLFEELDP